MTAPVDPTITRTRRLGLTPSFSASLAPPGKWARDAACGGRAGLFDPLDSHMETRTDFAERVGEAKTLCARCPVLDQCRTWTENTPRARVAGVLAGTYFRQIHPGMAGFHARRTVFPAA